MIFNRIGRGPIKAGHDVLPCIILNTYLRTGAWYERSMNVILYIFYYLTCFEIEMSLWHRHISWEDVIEHFFVSSFVGILDIYSI